MVTNTQAASPIARIGKAEYKNENLIPGLQHELLLYVKGGGSYKSLSATCGGHPRPGTIARITSGQTKDPRMSTVVLIFFALGFSIIAKQDN